MDYIYPGQAGNEASKLIAEILGDRQKSKTEPLTVSERIALAQVCALMAVGHEIGELTKAAHQISHGISANAKAADMLARAISSATGRDDVKESVHITKHSGSD